MKKLLFFLLFIFYIQSFSQETAFPDYIEYYFLEPSTGAHVYKNITIDVKYGAPKNLVLRLKSPSLKNGDSNAWSLTSVNGIYSPIKGSNLMINSTTSGSFSSSGSQYEDLKFFISYSSKVGIYKHKYEFLFTQTIYRNNKKPYTVSHPLTITVNYKPIEGDGSEGSVLTSGTGICDKSPSGLTYSSIGDNYTFKWDNVNGTMPYTIAFLPRGSKNWIFYTSNTNTYSIPLTPSHMYSVTVRANCNLWSEIKEVKTYNKCDENVSIDKSNLDLMNFQANNLLTITNSTLKNSNSRGTKIILKDSKILPKTKIYVQGCYGNKNENSIDDVIYSDIQSEISDSIAIVNNIIPTSTFKTTTENTFTISPNPTSSQVQINSTGGINEWFVYDINAKVVLAGNNKNINTLKVNLQSLPAGLYYFKFTDTTGTLHEKTIIKK
ncbi:hypothetical protein AS589_02775 [Empedobacter brevis]|uniref:T9SS type A sorting domain-containing protein n=1 Tax=Empedobacter brevis TaxID=247 RepID=UPI00131F6729|nr:T9SS type A sorting domain-containing protein [Empedobacter brevis]QHC83788.1 hypothetical protein AS589_02775 [Empedobacter brevis]